MPNTGDLIEVPEKKGEGLGEQLTSPNYAVGLENNQPGFEHPTGVFRSHLFKK